MTTSRMTATLIAFLAIAALSAIVMVAIGANRVLELVVGVFVIGAICIGLAAVGVNLYSRMSASRAA